MQGTNQQDITLVFRLDDYSAISNTAFEEQLIEVFRKRGWSCTFGVIPCVAKGAWFDYSKEHEQVPLTPKKGALLRSAAAQGVVDVALHGLTHQSAGRYDGVHHGEFAGIPARHQREKLEKGQAVLTECFGQAVDLFIPPWNSYDANTLVQLEDLQFEAISSGGRDGSVLKRGNLKYLPGTCTLIQLKDAVQEARNASDVGAIIVVVLHEYEFEEVDANRGKLTFQSFEDQLRWVADQPDIQVRSMRALLMSPQVDTGAKRFALNHQIRHFRRLTPPALRRMLPRAFHLSYPLDVYWTASSARRARNKVYLITALAYFLVWIMFVLLAFGLTQVSGWSMEPLWLGGSTLLLMGVGGLLTAKKKLYYRGALLLTVLTGICVGLWMTLL